MGRTEMRRDVLAWLLEPENPAVRCGALRDLLGRPAGDPEVAATRAAIPTSYPAAALLAAQKPEGYWARPDYYLPKSYSTFHVLCALGDLGLTREHEAIRRGCAFMFDHQRESGAFCRRRRVPGQGTIWEEQNDRCTHARIVRFLVQFGYGDDPRTRAALDWLLAMQRDDGMWLCDRAGRHGCLRATLDYLRAATLDEPAAAHPATARAAAVVAELLMQPGMGRYHVGDQWTILEYPYLGYGAIPALEALARLGYTAEHPRVREALDWLRGRQLPDSSWPLDQAPHRPPFDPGRPGQPNKWLTLDALRVLALYSPS
jgi:hypothetical protein